MKLLFLSTLKGPRSCSQDQNSNLDQDLAEYTIIFYKLILNADTKHSMVIDGQHFSNTVLRLLLLVANIKI